MNLIGFMIFQGFVHMPQVKKNEIYLFLFPAFDLDPVFLGNLGEHIGGTRAGSFNITIF